MVKGLRLAHGIALLLGVWMSVLMLLSLPMGGPSTTLMVLGLNLGLLVTQLFIAWCAWWRFETTSFRAALLSFLVWLVLFVWQGWLPPAPWFRKEEVLTDETLWDDLPRLALIAAWVGSYMIFPALRYIGGKGPREHREAGE